MKTFFSKLVFAVLFPVLVAASAGSASAQSCYPFFMESRTANDVIGLAGTLEFYPVSGSDRTLYRKSVYTEEWTSGANFYKYVATTTLRDGAEGDPTLYPGYECWDKDRTGLTASSNVTSTTDITGSTGWMSAFTGANYISSSTSYPTNETTDGFVTTHTHTP